MLAGNLLVLLRDAIRCTPNMLCDKLSHKNAHYFILFYCVCVIKVSVDSYDAFTHILQDCFIAIWTIFDCYGPLARYVKLRVVHPLWMPGTFFPTPRVSDPGMHHGTCVPHVPRCMPGSLPTGFLWCRWRGKRSRYSRRMRSQQFCVSGKRPIEVTQKGRSKSDCPYRNKTITTETKSCAWFSKCNVYTTQINSNEKSQTEN